MKTRVALFGFGRLGRAVYAVASKRRDLEVVMVATGKSPEAIVDALVNDVIYSSLEEAVEAAPGGFVHEEHHVHVRTVKTADVWKGHEIDLVIDTLTKSPDKDALLTHQHAGAKRVVFAAPGKDVATIIYGQNDDELAEAEGAVSGGGAERAGVEPIFGIIDATFGREKSLVTTVDGTLCSCQGGECSAEHIAGVNLFAPKLLSSLSEAIVYTKKAVTQDGLTGALKQAAKEAYYQGIVEVSEEPVVPDNVIGQSVSALVDLSKTSVDGRLASVKIWYDREWGYANRLVELAADFGKLKENKRAD